MKYHIKKEEHKYCSLCGSAMKEKLIPDINRIAGKTHKFNTKTGEQYFAKVLVCPKRDGYIFHDFITLEDNILKSEKIK